jgi:hypothetical protein
MTQGIKIKFRKNHKVVDERFIPSTCNFIYGAVAQRRIIRDMEKDIDNAYSNIIDYDDMLLSWETA